MFYLTRSQSITLASIIIGGLLVASVAVVKIRSRRGEVAQTTSQNAAAVPTAAGTNAPGAQFMLENFHRSESKNGKTSWEVTAKRGQYFPLTQHADVEEALVSLFEKDGKRVAITAPKARLSLSGTSLVGADISNGVVVVVDDQTTIRTDHATYDKVHDKIHSDAPVQIENEMISVAGNSIDVDMVNQVVVIDGGVQTVIKPKKQES